jgi:hypothetical protein
MPTGIYSNERRKGLFSKGHIPWSKGEKLPPMSDLTKKKMSATKKGIRPTSLFGIDGKIKPEIIEKMRIAKLGTHLPAEIRKKQSDALIGKIPANNLLPGKFSNVQRGWYKIGTKKLFFRSKWEANYALYLSFLKKQGDILKWEYETEVFIFHKIQFGTRSFRPDFKVIKRNGEIEYHEVKGWMTPKSKVQLKRMRIYYPNVKVIVIGTDAYRDIKNKVGKMLKFYD